MKISTGYYQENKESLSREDKNKKQKYGLEQHRNLCEEEKNKKHQFARE